MTGMFYLSFFDRTCLSCWCTRRELNSDQCRRRAPFYPIRLRVHSQSSFCILASLMFAFVDLQFLNDDNPSVQQSLRFMLDSSRCTRQPFYMDFFYFLKFATRLIYPFRLVSTCVPTTHFPLSKGQSFIRIVASHMGGNPSVTLHVRFVRQLPLHYGSRS